MTDRDVISDVLRLQAVHADTWADRPDGYWLARLVGEVGELGCALVGDHEHPPEWELKQIAAICINWLRHREHRQFLREHGEQQLEMPL